jgi:hypothetical protein
MSKNLYEGYPMKFLCSTQNPKKIIETPNQLLRTNIFPKKVCLVPKKKRNRTFLWELPDGICRLHPKPKKNNRNIKSTNQNELFPKRSMFSKEPEIRIARRNSLESLESIGVG